MEKKSYNTADDKMREDLQDIQNLPNLLANLATLISQHENITYSTKEAIKILKNTSINIAINPNTEDPKNSLNYENLELSLLEKLNILLDRFSKLNSFALENFNILESVVYDQ